MAAAVVLILGGGAFLFAVVYRWLSQSWLIRLFWNWHTGLPLDGISRTNATWARRSHGDKPVLHPSGHAIRWHHLSRLERAAIRITAEITTFGLVYGLLTAPAETEAVLAAITFTFAGFVVWRAWAAARRWRHHRRYVRPLYRTLTRELGAPPPRLAIEPDRSRIELWLHEDFNPTAKEKEAILSAITVKLGIEAPDPEWGQLAGRKPRAVFTKSVPPPARVTSADILPAVRAAAEHEVVLGIGKKGQVIDVSLDSESPHLGFCMTTGDGKSMAATNVSAQILWHGGIVVMLDYKLMSHMWARGLPNVAYAGIPSELHAMLCWLANDDEHESELTRRKQVALASADIRGNVTADIGPRILIVAEELNVTQKILKSYWRKIGGKGPSPAAEALDEVMFTGRQLRVHVLQIGQRLSAKATSGSGSADSRENLGAIVFSNPSASTWKMLCDGHAQPPASDHKGRYQVVSRKEVREMQGALWDEEDARAFATAGTVAVARHDMPFITQRVPVVVGQSAPSAIDAPDQRFVVGQPTLVPPRPTGAVTLTEAVAGGLFPSIAAARKAAQRGSCGDTVGGEGQAKLYDLAAIYARRNHG